MNEPCTCSVAVSNDPQPEPSPFRTMSVYDRARACSLLRSSPRPNRKRRVGHWGDTCQAGGQLAATQSKPTWSIDPGHVEVCADTETVIDVIGLVTADFCDSDERSGAVAALGDVDCGAGAGRTSVCAVGRVCIRGAGEGRAGSRRRLAETVSVEVDAVAERLGDGASTPARRRGRGERRHRAGRGEEERQGGSGKEGDGEAKGDSVSPGARSVGCAMQ